MRTASAVQGHVEDGWGKVADVFRANFDQPGEIGAACCVYANGRPVVDLWGGLADRAAGRAWRSDTIAQVASTTKGATAICAHLLVERGLLDLEAPVTRYWPEFGAHGKEGIPVRWLLSHQAGLPIVDTPLTFDQTCAWEPVIRALESQQPLWQPGTEHLYHPVTYGFLVGEVVRRVSGMSLGTFFATEVAAPLGLNAWIGLPPEQEERVASMEYEPAPAMEDRIKGFAARTGLDSADVALWIQAVYGPGSVFARFAEQVSPADPSNRPASDRTARAVELPASNMVTDARSLARMYASTVSDVDGIRLLQPATVERMTVVQTDRTRMHGVPPALDLPADRSFNMSLGFWRACPALPMAGPASFGHPGAGGSIGFADPESDVGFGYIPNLGMWEVTDRRADHLAAAVSACS